MLAERANPGSALPLNRVAFLGDRGSLAMGLMGLWAPIGTRLILLGDNGFGGVLGVINCCCGSLAMTLVVFRDPMGIISP